MSARTLLTAALLLASAACTSLPRPTTAPAPALASGDAPGLTLWSPASGTAGLPSAGLTYFTVDRDAYAAAFTVTRDGRLRVLWPESPGDDGYARAGKTYRANGTYAQFGAFMAGARNAVPYVFVITSDQRLDLSRFGSGSRWRYQVNLDELGGFADDAVASVASLILPSPDAAYAADYAFVGPRLSGSALYLTMQCGLRNVDARNYQFYRDLWATFDPWDSYLGPIGFASAWSFWPGGWFPFSGRGLMSLYADRASRANAAFWGGCPAFSPSLSYAYGNPFLGRGGVLLAGNAPVLPTAPVATVPGGPRDTTSANGANRFRIRPQDEINGAGLGAARRDEAAERRAALRERLATAREERRRGGAERVADLGLDRRPSLRTERLTTIDVTGLERRARAAELAELGFRSARGFDDGAERWRSAADGVGRSRAGRGSDGWAGGSSSGARASGGDRAIDRSADRGSSGMGSASRGDGGSAARGGGESRGGGSGESRGSAGGEGTSRRP
jgi:hypothetical protein